MLKKAVKNSVPLLITWVVFYILLCFYYTPKIIAVTDLSVLSTGSVYTPDSEGKQKLLNKLADSFSQKIGVGLLEYNISIENNFRLVFESKTAQPPLAYAPSVLTITSRNGESKKIAYLNKNEVANSVQRDEIFNIMNSILLETQEPPQPKQVFPPNSLLNISTVGNLVISQQLNAYSRIHIGVFSFIAVLALINWIRQLMAFLILGSRKFFFGH